MIEERRREEEKKRRGGREGRESKERSRGSKPSRRLDIIDQLDATSIYGTGRTCNLPHGICRRMACSDYDSSLSSRRTI